MKRLLVNSLIVLTSLLLTFSLLEGGYRLVTYLNAINGYAPFTFWWVDQALFLEDAEVGYRYAPGVNVRYTQTRADNVSVHASNVISNRDGLVSTDDVPLEKADGEFRIALIGDSFTAGVFNDQPWSRTLQALLNADTALLDAWGAERVTVLNFGMEAVGLVQFDDIYQQRAAAYAPDLVIAGFISDDIRRRFVWRGVTQVTYEDRTWDLHLNCYSLPISVENPACDYSVLILPQFFVAEAQRSDPATLDRLRRDLYFSDIARRPWFSIYPELLAATIGGQIGLPPRLARAREAASVRLYANDGEAFTRSREALDNLIASAPDTLLLHIPTHLELLNNALDAPAPAFLATQADLDIIETGPLLRADPEVSEADILSWYNVPHDGHFSDAGSTAFAEVVHGVLRNRQLR